MIASCFLSFINNGFDHPMEALEYVCWISGIEAEDALLPSHERYLSYFGYVMCGYIPVKWVIRLERIIMNGIPDIETTFVRWNGDDSDSEENRLKRSSCSPYIQIFKGE